MPTNLRLLWSTSNITNTDVSISIFYGSTKLFGSKVRADCSTFFYSLDTTTYYSSSGYNYSSNFYTNTAWRNGDATTASVNLWKVTVLEETYGQSHIATHFATTLSKLESYVSTPNRAKLDRTEGSGRVFFQVHDTSLLLPNKVINPEKAYDGDVYDAALFASSPSDVTGAFKLYRNTTKNETGVDGTVYLDFTCGPVSHNSILDIYLDYTSNNDYTSGTYIGSIYSYQLIDNSNYIGFSIPSSLMENISDSSFYTTSLYVVHRYDSTDPDVLDTTYLMRDAYIGYQPTAETSILTDNTCIVYDATVPSIYRQIYTRNKAALKKGGVYVLDYYTPPFWSYTTSNTFTYNDWNRLEIILQNLGRYSHSPIYYGARLPFFGCAKIILGPTRSAHSIDENIEGFPINIIKKTGITADGIACSSSISNSLSLYNPAISPNIINQDGTVYKLVPCVADNTVFITFYRKNSGEYVPWKTATYLHPFTSSKTFYLKFFGKK